jgi:hypothetical protein
VIRKLAALQVLDAWQVPARVTAGRLVKLAHRVEFDYTPRPGYLYVRSRAISSRANDNHDEFPAREIEAAYRSFLGKPVFVNHHNANHRRARGVIVAVALHRDRNPDGSPDTWAEVLQEIDARRFPKLCKAIIEGRVNRTSMGVDVERSVCSACGNQATDPAQYCRHLPALKGRKIRKRNPKTGKLHEEIIREICHGLSFFENSLLVEDPADPTAYVLGKPDTRGMQAAASRRTADTDRTKPHPGRLQGGTCRQACDYGGTHCAVCHEGVRVNLHKTSMPSEGWYHDDGMRRDHPATPADPQGVMDSIPGQLARKDQVRNQVADTFQRQLESLGPVPPRRRRDEDQMPPDPFTTAMRRQAEISDEEIQRGLGLPGNDRERASEEGKELGHQLHKFWMDVEHPGETEESMRSTDNLKAADHLHKRYESGIKNGTGHVKFDEEEESPYYEIKHRHPSGTPSGWTIRHYMDGPQAEVRHEATPQETHEMFDIGRDTYGSGADPGSWEHPPEGFGHEHLKGILDRWHAGAGNEGEGGAREHLEGPGGDRRIRRWKAMHRGASRRQGAAEEEHEHPVKAILRHLNDSHGIDNESAAMIAPLNAMNKGRKITPWKEDDQVSQLHSMVDALRELHDVHKDEHGGQYHASAGIIPHSHGPTDPVTTYGFHPHEEDFMGRDPESQVVKPSYHPGGIPGYMRETEMTSGLHPERTDAMPNLQAYNDPHDEKTWSNISDCPHCYRGEERDKSFRVSAHPPELDIKDHNAWKRQHDKEVAAGAMCPHCGAYKWMHASHLPSEIGKPTEEWNERAREDWREKTRGKTAPFVPSLPVSLSSFVRQASPRYAQPGDHPFFKANPVSADNIVNAYHDTTDDERNLGERWYSDAHHVAKAIAGGDAAKGAGVLAAYSPRTAWPVNLINASHALHHPDDPPGPGSGAMGMHQAPAKRILAGEHHSDVLNGPKVRAFASLIEHGGQTDEDVANGTQKVVIDRHALATAVGRRLSDKDAASAPIGQEPYYGHVASEYDEASRQLSLHYGRHIPAEVVQAGVWLRQQRLNRAEDQDQTFGGKGRLTRERNATKAWHSLAHERHPGIEQGNMHVHFDTGIEHSHEPEDPPPSPAVVMSGTRQAMKRLAYGETKVPPEINTLRQEECPVCGEAQVWTGQRCPVCGYVAPPDLFRDPDTSKAKDVRDQLTDEGDVDVPPEGQGSWPDADAQMWHPDQIAPNGMPAGPPQGPDATQLAQEPPALACPACGAEVPPETADEGDPCPECGQAPLTAPEPAEEDEGGLEDPEAAEAEEMAAEGDPAAQEQLETEEGDEEADQAADQAMEAEEDPELAEAELDAQQERPRKKKGNGGKLAM